MPNTDCQELWVAGRRRRRGSIGIGVSVAAVVLAACGGDDGAAGSTSTTLAVTSTLAPATSAPTTTAPATTGASSTTSAATAAPSTTDAAGDACREITHELGTACVPAHPQRIVVLDTLLALPTLLDAGAPVVGSLSVYDVGEPFPSFVDPAASEGIDIVGSLQEPNLERIAAARPDLIVGASVVIEPLQAQLEAIAPVVATKYAFYVPTWRDDVRLVADAAGVLDAAEASITDLDARIAALRSVITANGASPTLTRVDVFTGTPLYYEYECSAFGEVLLSVGIRQPEAQIAECTPDDYQSILKYPSLEQLDVLDADVIVTYQQQAGSGDVGASPLAVLEASPLWAGLPAVQSGDVHVVGDAWGLGASVPAFQAMLDDVEAFFG